ncbi:DUF3054 domain-containing protein [Phytoactinopolyspora endophytica]|uniref:DUF3054 domain-containing protein n=1 Tax=Phytoactinopolyspora endophytica TaxID=1642495 RepID=UPI001F0EF770|nr:DUF3054 domain-containing protein [Phytoactinopolyspora endophytica]
MLVAGLIDLVLVASFALAGRGSHNREIISAGYVTTVWPFAAATAVGWLITRAWRRPFSPVRAGLGIWLVAVAGGMVLRALSGQGTAATFVVVATVTLGMFLVGWRLIAAYGLRRKHGLNPPVTRRNSRSA